MDKISDLKKIIVNALDSNKALDIISIDLASKSSMADYMIIASGTSSLILASSDYQMLVSQVYLRLLQMLDPK